MDAQLHDPLLRAAVRLILLDGVQNSGQLVAQEDGHHGGRRFVGAQTVIVAGGSHRQPQQILIIIHRLNNGAQEQQEPGVLIGRVAGRQQVHAGIGGDGPVVVLAGAVDAVKGLLMEQTYQTVTGSYLLHDLHGQLVVVGGHVGGGVDGSQLMLGGGHLVMLGLGQNAQLPQLLVQVGHVGRHTGFDGAEIVVVHLLTLGRLRAEQSAATEDQILALVEHLAVHQKILLLRADGGTDAFHILVAEQVEDAHGLLVQGLHRAQQRCFLIQRFAAVGTERRGDAQGLILDKGIGGGIPRGIAAGLEGGAQAAGGEAGSVRFALDQLLAGELHDDAAVGRRGDEAVVLFGGDAGQGLEPMGKMGGAMLDGPILHGVCHSVGHFVIQAAALIDRFFQRGVDFIGKPCFHDAVVKNQTAEVFRYCAHHDPLLFF